MLWGLLALSERRNEILSVIKTHLSDWEPTEWEKALLCDDWFLNTDEFFIADPDQQITKIDDLMDALKAAWASYNQLNPAVRKAMEMAFLRNMKNSPASTQVKPTYDNEPIIVYQPLELLLRTILGNMQGRDPDILLDSMNGKRFGERANREAALAVDLLKKPSGKEVASETWEKATLVARARKLWFQHRGSLPPKKPSEGADFFKFVSDLIEALGKDWNTESTFNAWRSRLDDMDRYGLES